MKHLEEHNTSYFPHMVRALAFGFKCLLWTLEVVVHALVPELCTRTSEKMKAEIKRLEGPD